MAWRGTVGKTFTSLTDSDAFYKADSNHDNLNSRQGIGIFVAVYVLFYFYFKSALM